MLERTGLIMWAMLLNNCPNRKEAPKQLIATAWKM